MRFSLIILMIFGFLSAQSLPVTIYGKSSAASAFVFRLYLSEDALSGLEKVADQQRPNNNGDFILGFETQKIQEVKIMVGMQSMKFYVIPGHTYHLNFNEITLENQNVFLPQSPLKVIFEKEDMLNVAIDGFNYDYQKFLENDFMFLVKYRDRNRYEEFASAVKEKMNKTPLTDSVSSLFFKNYIYFRLADLRLAARLQKEQALGLETLSYHTIMLHNPTYVDFFKKYFKNYLHEWKSGEDYDKLKKLINSGPSINELDDLLGNNPVLVEEKLRELLLLYVLKQSFYKTGFSQKSINEILDQHSKNSKFIELQAIASNLKIALNRFVRGEIPPLFNLSNLQGDTKSLSDYSGTKIYLMFVNPNCETCETDIRIIKTVQADYAHLIKFVSIYSSHHKTEAQEWVKKQQAPWDFLWFNDDYQLLNDYQVKTYPKYILLDENGKLEYYFPPKPRENLISYLKALQKKKDQEKIDKKDIFRSN